MSLAPDLVPLLRLGPALGRSKVTSWRHGKAGRYGRVTFDAHGRQCVSLAEVERVEGVVFDEVQRAALLAKSPAKSADRHAPAATGALPALPILLAIDPGVVAHYIESRDGDWITYLSAKFGEIVAPPPLPPHADITFDNQEVFTRSQVEALLESTVRQRDGQWRAWWEDSVARAQFPDGPPDPLAFKYHKPE